MADENENSKPDSRDNSSQTCSLCSGTGKLYLNSDDDDMDICGRAVRTMLCPLCRGRGKVRHYSLRHMRIRLRPRSNRMLLRRRRPSSGRGGKFSRSPILLLPPCLPTSGWQEGDMVPKSTPESAYIGQDINYPIITDAEIPRDEYPRETILKIPPNITITLGREFAPNLVLDPDFTEINFQEPLEAGSDPVSAQIVYGARSNELWEMFSRWFDPFNQPAVIQLKDELYAVVGNKGQLLDLEPHEVHTETHISEYDSRLHLDIENEPARELTLQPHQSTSAAFTDVLGPDVPGEGTSLDITADVEDPIGFDVNTNIVGDTW